MPSAVAVVVVVEGAEVVVDAGEAAVVDVEVLVVVLELDDVVCAAEGKAAATTTENEKSANAYDRRRGRVLTRSSVARRRAPTPSLLG